MSRFRLTSRALRDLDDNTAYSLHRWGAKQTERYIAALYERMQWLADNPMLGRSRNEVAPSYRSFRQGSHIVFYIIADNEIAVIGVPHGSMDIDAFFEQREEESG